ncbi:lytic transglycosylase domain-containing protein [Novosphingobium album (ex Liu et al. 2023)]|uniref:Lytic transglycosylase domain-containing protein n=1 Tax=Novosphingobium album (ex Liu et al. 2023) TaxID=3031130 RepID=A0ABT5WQ50_9SPHN|nr:lytic transglycosylase domain-containing protein [Novosphingobium album (ex Liu et al. 2023)]MDE8652172.1 lytic transglycosylase domain-containing protein [Novosphingobium album (ex Liu et al. 2023)]
MDALRLWIAAASLVFASLAHAQSVADWRPYIVEASDRFGVPVAWIEAVMQAESRGRTTLGGRPIRSSAGAMGVMQLMPATWAQMRARLGLGSNPDDPRDNILAGTLYLRLMYDRFGYPGLFAAYNAGPGRYAEHLAGRRSLPSETIGYLASVAPSARGTVAAPMRLNPSAAIFAVRRDVLPADRASMKAPSASSLFVTLSQRD